MHAYTHTGGEDHDGMEMGVIANTRKHTYIHTCMHTHIQEAKITMVWRWA